MRAWAGIGGLNGRNCKRPLIAGAPAIIKTYGVADAAAWEVGLPCGGEIAVLIQPVLETGFDPVLFDQIDVARASGKTLIVSTDLASGHSSLDADDGLFANSYPPQRQLLIVGAVQIAQSLVGIAQQLGIAPVVIDPRARYLTEERFPGVQRDETWPDEAIAAYNPGRTTAVVTLSHDIKIDDPALIAALRAPTGYVGALGSRKSHAARLERLRAQGFSEVDLARIDGPTGVSIGAIGPAEIALSIAAGMVKAFRA